MKPIFTLLFFLILTSCSTITGGKHLNEKIFKSGDLTIRWYRISDITTIHDFVDVERWGWAKTIMKANTDGIYDIIIKNDTITIQTTKGLLVYDLTVLTLNCYIKIDSSITHCQYIQKYVPENAKYYCDSSSIDTTK